MKVSALNVTTCLRLTLERYTRFGNTANNNYKPTGKYTMSILTPEQMQDFNDLCKAQGQECAIKAAEASLLTRLRKKQLRHDEQQVLLEALRKELSSRKS